MNQKKDSSEIHVGLKKIKFYKWIDKMSRDIEERNRKFRAQIKQQCDVTLASSPQSSNTISISPQTFQNEHLESNPFDYHNRTASHTRSYNEKFATLNNTMQPRRNMPITSTPYEEMVSSGVRKRVELQKENDKNAAIAILFSLSFSVGTWKLPISAFVS